MTVKTSKLSEVLTLKNHENHDFFKNTDFWLPNSLDNGSSRILGLLYSKPLENHISQNVISHFRVKM